MRWKEHKPNILIYSKSVRWWRGKINGQNVDVVEDDYGEGLILYSMHLAFGEEHPAMKIEYGFYSSIGFSTIREGCSMDYQ